MDETEQGNMYEDEVNNEKMEDEPTDSSGGNADDSDSSEDEDEEQLMGKATELEKQLAENPYLYDAHKELIIIHKTVGDLDELRRVRQRFSELYPLTEELWMEWINDERALISTEEEKEELVKLFTKAINDYQSLQLWLEYCTFAIGLGDGDRCRQIMSQAIDNIGYHLTDGKLVWDLAIEYEQALLSTKQPAPGSCLSSDQQAEMDAQTKRVSDLYTKLLETPLVGIQSALVEYEQWSGETITDELRDQHNKALTVLENCNKFENDLVTAQTDESKAEVYTNYIKSFREYHPDMISCIKCLYERALVTGCLDQNLWLDYVNYLEQQFQKDSNGSSLTPEVILSVYNRAIRNCPWSGTLWVGYCMYSEKWNVPLDTLEGYYETALVSSLSSGYDYLTVWCSYCDSIRRHVSSWSDTGSDPLIQKLRDTLERAILHLLKYFGEDGDSECLLPKYWAHVEAKHCNNMEKARQIWNDTLTGYRNNKATAWLEYVTFERFYGDHKHCRRVFQRALKSVTDWPESICSEYIRFEREEGSLEQLYVAQARVDEVRKQIAETEKQRKPKFDNRKGNRKQQTGDSKPQKSHDKTQKNKQQTKKEKKTPQADGNPNKEPVIYKRKHSNDQAESEDPAFKKPKLPPSKAASAAGDGDFKVPSVTVKSTSTKLGDNGQADTKENPDYTSTDFRTVFVSNLAFSTNEDQLKDLFSKCGEIKEVRIMKGKGDKSKGFAYVEFTSTQPVASALLMDRTEIEGRPMYVSECHRDRTPTDHKFKYNTGLEKNKLFISGLSFDTTKEHLTEVFEKYGKVRDTRLVTYKGGKSKGLAYIEYHTEDEAKKALLTADGSIIDGFTIKVAFSNPPGRKAPANQPPPRIQSLGAGNKQATDSQPRGRGRTQLNLTPRSVQQPPGKPAASKPGTGSNIQPAPSQQNKSVVQGKMSNSDFRAMLLGKK